MLNKKSNLRLFGDLKERTIKAKSRFSFILFCLFFGFFLITLKIINLSVNYNKKLVNNPFKQNQLVTGFRADIIDRNGDLLATSILKDDLVAKPRLIPKTKKKIIAKKISKILPELTFEDILKKLESRKSFVYLQRSISPTKYNEGVFCINEIVFRFLILRLSLQETGIMRDLTLRKHKKKSNLYKKSLTFYISISSSIKLRKSKIPTS